MRCGRVVMWSCGRVVVWSCGRVVMWSCGRVVVWSCGHVVVWPRWHFHRLVAWSLGRLGTSARQVPGWPSHILVCGRAALHLLLSRCPGDLITRDLGPGRLSEGQRFFCARRTPRGRSLERRGFTKSVVVPAVQLVDITRCTIARAPTYFELLIARSLG